MPATVDVIIEVPQWSFVKRKGDGSIDFVSPLPSPFPGYGSVPAITAEDGDPLDAIVLGPRCRYGETVRSAHVRGYLRFTDAGQIDNKLICTRGRADPVSGQDLLVAHAFFRLYAAAKTVLNAARGKKGVTKFEGWVPVGGAGPAAGARR